MPASFSNFVTAKHDPICVKGANIDKESGTVVAVLKAILPQGETKPGGKEPPIRYVILLAEESSLKFFQTEKEKKANKALPEAEQMKHEIKTFPKLSTIVISMFGGPLNLITGRAYDFLGSFYQTYQSDPEREPAVSLRCTQIKSIEYDVDALFKGLTFEQYCIKGNANPSFFAVRIEQDAAKLEAVIKVPGQKISIGQLQIPAVPGENDLVRSYGDPSKGVPMRTEISLTAGKLGNTYLDPIVIVFQSDGSVDPKTGAPFGDKIALQFYCNASTFSKFMLTPFEWIALAPNILPHATGLFYGDIDSNKTEALPETPADVDAIYYARGVLSLDEVETIRRAGVPLDSWGVAQFLNLSELDSAFWDTSASKNDKTACIINLSNVKGDASQLKEAIDGGALHAYVVSNWGIDASDFAKLRALSMKDRVEAILGSKEKINLCYGKNMLVHAVYVLGPGVTRAITASQPKKKARI